MPNHRNTAERFWASLDRSAGPDSCWAWQRPTDRDGYGEVAVYGQGKMRAHRAAWFYAYGADPVGRFVLHRCDNPRCCNPAHLFLGSAADNHADAMSKGRHSHGERHGRSKLTADVVRALRDAHAHDVTIRDLAIRHGVSEHAVWSAVHRVTWAHVA